MTSPKRARSKSGGEGRGAPVKSEMTLQTEPNPFEQSFRPSGGGAGGASAAGAGMPPAKLPSVSALTSPSPPGVAGTFWGGSLRSGPLSPAMLSGPTSEFYDAAPSFKPGFSESSLRTGMTPGSSTPVYPLPSPGGQPMLPQLGTGTATPGMMDFHRTALAANRDKKAHSTTQALPPMGSMAATSEAPVAAMQAPMAHAPPVFNKPPTEGAPPPVDNHASDAANGLFMMAQQRSQNRDLAANAVAAAGSERKEDEPKQGRKRSTANARKKLTNGAPGSSDSMAAANGQSAGSSSGKPPAKRQKRGKNDASESDDEQGGGEDKSEMMDGEDEGEDGGGSKQAEKRKNFLERNRIAALKCRQRKKQWLTDLQGKIEMYETENHRLIVDNDHLRGEVEKLQAILRAHKDCPVTRRQNPGYMPADTVAFPPTQQNMAVYPMAQNVVVAAAGQERRFS